jgi:plastocyanin
MTLKLALRNLGWATVLLLGLGVAPVAPWGAAAAAGGAPALAASLDEKLAAGAEVAEVRIENFSFAPAALEVAAGTAVTWVNHDDMPHTVVSSDNTTFKSKALDSGDKFSHVFAKPGRYSYYCSLHPRMTGTVLVR